MPSFSDKPIFTTLSTLRWMLCYALSFFPPAREEAEDSLQRLAGALGRVDQLGFAADSAVSHEDAAFASRAARFSGAGLDRSQRSDNGNGRRSGGNAGSQPRVAGDRAHG